DPYDVNGDGVFDVRDYTTDNRESDPRDVCDTTLRSRIGGWDSNRNGFSTTRSDPRLLRWRRRALRSALERYAFDALLAPGEVRHPEWFVEP
ncbi:MAG: hypothetical protein HC807_07680, partial [Gammaproteobacteria bacterium]|nr:hypothetical protein [Gammaproteobacteria bacterium]